MNEQPPTAVPSTHFGVRPEIMRDRYRRLAGGRDAVDVGTLSPASAIALSAASACNWICDMSGMTPSFVVSAAPTMAMRVVL
jgi:hypothetical protein